MYRWIAWLAMNLLILSIGRSDPLDRTLGAVGLTRESARFDPGDMSNFGGGEFQIPLFKTLHGDPYKIPAYIPVLKQEAVTAAPSLHESVTRATQRLGQGLRRGWLSDPLTEVIKKSESPDGLLQAISEIHARYGRKLRRNQEIQLQTAIASLPSEVAKQAAYLLYAALEVLPWREKAFAGALRRFPQEDLFKMAMEWGVEADLTLEMYEFMHRVDLAYLFSGAEDLALAIDRAADALTKSPVEASFSFVWDTPLGRIALNGAGSHTYAEKEKRFYLLILDTGGDDRYEGGAATVSWKNPVSLVMDVAGNDRYMTPESKQPAFGAGVCGYGFLIDAAGNDRYDSMNLSQGSGFFGVGGLLDRRGEDFYTAYTASQGSAQFGIGILSDLEGNDRYTVFQSGQGFGGTRGMGLLADLSGNDLYTANDTRIDFPSAQTEEHNASLSQGAGFGRRADIVDGHSLAGGVGMLADASGDDRYSAGLFAQGAGYWYGLGILADGEGNDIYSGVWYVQASAAHFAVGVLYDSGGDDAYKATMNMAIGAGHDFSVGFLVDESGTDRYDAPSLSLGGGNANGIGLFWDKKGDDTYNVSGGASLGQANPAGKESLREKMLCLGVFLDTGGSDTYSRPVARNNTLWTQPEATQQKAGAKGVGLDGEGE